MVRTKSSEQAKRLAAKQAARKAKAPPDEPAQPDSFLAQMLRDRRAAADQPETAEEAARAETIAQTRLGAVMAATLCRTNFTQGLQGNSKAVVELLGEGSLTLSRVPCRRPCARSPRATARDQAGKRISSSRRAQRAPTRARARRRSQFGEGITENTATQSVIHTSSTWWVLPCTSWWVYWR